MDRARRAPVGDAPLDPSARPRVTGRVGAFDPRQSAAAGFPREEPRHQPVSPLVGDRLHVAERGAEGDPQIAVGGVHETVVSQRVHAHIQGPVDEVGRGAGCSRRWGPEGPRWRIRAPPASDSRANDPGRPKTRLRAGRGAVASVLSTHRVNVSSSTLRSRCAFITAATALARTEKPAFQGASANAATTPSSVARAAGRRNPNPSIHMLHVDALVDVPAQPQEGNPACNAGSPCRCPRRTPRNRRRERRRDRARETGNEPGG